jgi:transcription elongation GreA/GreB family factor
MSRAFVKELEDAAEELPERPISPHPNLVTAEGLAHIEAEVTRLQQDHAAAQAANDRTALADEADPTHGTLSHVSPLARALFGKQVGDTIEVAQKEAEILEIA